VYVVTAYQSRLFNFLTDRAIQWSDRAAQALRQARFTATMAATTAARWVLLPMWMVAQRVGVISNAFGGTPPDRSAFAPMPATETDASTVNPGTKPGKTASVASDAAIRATLTVLEAAGWQTIDRLDRHALQLPVDPPDRENVAAADDFTNFVERFSFTNDFLHNSGDEQAVQAEPVAQKPRPWWLSWLPPKFTDVKFTDVKFPNITAKTLARRAPQPIRIELTVAELQAIAPAQPSHPIPAHPTPSHPTQYLPQAIAPALPENTSWTIAPQQIVQGLASELGTNHLVLVSTANQPIAYLGSQSQQVLDRSVRTLLQHLAPSLPPRLPAAPALAGLPHFLQASLLEAPFLKPWLASTRSISQVFAEHVTQTTQPVIQPVIQAVTQSITQSIATPMQQRWAQWLDRLDTQVAQFELAQEASHALRSGFNSPHTFDLHTDLARLQSPQPWAQAQHILSQALTLTPFVTRLPAPDPLPMAGAAADSLTRLESQIDLEQVEQWAIDPADPWWQNAIDLTRILTQSMLRSITRSSLVAGLRAHGFTLSPQPTASSEANEPQDKSREILNLSEGWISSPSGTAAGSKGATPAIVQSQKATKPSFKAVKPAFQAVSTKLAATMNSVHRGLEFDPDWIDAEVHDHDYVMHPLERVLRWLDRAMATVERWLAAIIQRVTRQTSL